MFCPFKSEGNKRLVRCTDDVCAQRFKCQKFTDDLDDRSFSKGGDLVSLAGAGE